MKYVLALLGLLIAGAAQAQDALVVTACGTLPLAYTAGATRLLTVDVNGKLCGSSGGGGGTPGGSNTQVQYNNAGAFGGIIGATTDGTKLTLVAPVLGAATATSINGNAFTSGTYTLTGGAGKTLTFNNTLTLSGTDGSTLNVGAGGTLGTAAFQNTGTSGANVPLLNGANTFSGNTTLSSSSFGLSGNISAPAWTTAGIRYANVAATLTDTTSSGTVAAARSNNFAADTIAASSATTFTNYYGAYFGLPVAGTNVTLTNRYALGATSLVIGDGAGSISTTLTSSGGIAGSGSATINNFTELDITAGGFIGFTGRSYFSSPSNGVMLVSNAAITDFTRLQFGGTTSSFPSLKRSTTTLAVRLADDSADANLTAGNFTASGAAVIFSGLATDAAATDTTLCSKSSDGTVLKGSGTLGICLGTSSARYKSQIQDIAVGLPEILALPVRSFYLDKEHGDPDKMMYGFTAEDCAKVLPKLTGLDTEDRPNTCDYLGVVPVLVRAVQQQQAEIEALKKAR